MGRSDEQGKGSLTVAEELSRLLGIELESEPTASEAWEAQAEAEASREARQDAALQKEEAATYEEEQRLAAQSLWLQEEWRDYTDISRGR